VSHRRQPNRRKTASLVILAAAALTVLATTAFHSGNSANASPVTSTGTSATDASATQSSARDQATPTAVRTAAAEAGQPHHVVLVVGDSLIGQAEEQLREDSTPTFSVTTAYELGSAPCDWTNGRFDPDHRRTRGT
jgi:hypothetical protein